MPIDADTADADDADDELISWWPGEQMDQWADV